MYKLKINQQILIKKIKKLHHWHKKQSHLQQTTTKILFMFGSNDRKVNSSITWRIECFAPNRKFPSGQQWLTMRQFYDFLLPFLNAHFHNVSLVPSLSLAWICLQPLICRSSQEGRCFSKVWPHQHLMALSNRPANFGKVWQIWIYLRLINAFRC